MPSADRPLPFASPSHGPTDLQPMLLECRAVQGRAWQTCTTGDTRSLEISRMCRISQPTSKLMPALHSSTSSSMCQTTTCPTTQIPAARVNPFPTSTRYACLLYYAVLMLHDASTAVAAIVELLVYVDYHPEPDSLFKPSAWQ